MTSILLVEDHPIFAQALQRVLRDRGQMEVTAIATSAEEALEILPGVEVDLVLVDVSLPKQSGIGLVLVLLFRRLHARKKITVTPTKIGIKINPL